MSLKYKNEIINGFKVCNSCKINKDLSCYRTCKKTKSGICGICKDCLNIKQKIRRRNNPEKESNKIQSRIRTKRWVESNQNKVKKYKKEYYINNKNKISDDSKRLRKINKEKIKNNKKRYYEQNKDKILLKQKEWRDKNKIYVKTKKKEWKNLKKLTDPKFRLNNSMSYAIGRCIKTKDGKSWLNLVEYSKEELFLHLESKFTKGMNWDNYGKGGWEVDHIIPQNYFNHNGDYNHPAFKACWSLNNLQPLWATTKIAIKYGENKTYVGNADKQHRIVITQEIQDFLNIVNGDISG